MGSPSHRPYEQKRNLDHTPEPSGDARGKTRSSKPPRFVIQKHDASRLHYDFRLEAGDRLISWALPKGPSTAANERRLAIRTEDHPLGYAESEGNIPEGEYGAGTVLIWDRGHYEPLTDSDLDDDQIRAALEDGSLKFNLRGDKLQGGYALARIEMDGDEEKWVLFKLDDEHADARRNPVSTQPESVDSGRSLKEIRDAEEGTGNDDDSS